MTGLLYILCDHTPVEEPDALAWGKWMESKERIVAMTTVGDQDVSTVFLGIDHALGLGLPVLFETMIFGGEEDQYQERYSTWEEAEAGHAKAVEHLRSKFENLVKETAAKAMGRE